MIKKIGICLLTVFLAVFGTILSIGNISSTNNIFSDKKELQNGFNIISQDDITITEFELVLFDSEFYFDLSSNNLLTDFNDNSYIEACFNTDGVYYSGEYYERYGESSQIKLIESETPDGDPVIFMYFYVDDYTQPMSNTFTIAFIGSSDFTYNDVLYKGNIWYTPPWWGNDIIYGLKFYNVRIELAESVLGQSDYVNKIFGDRVSFDNNPIESSDPLDDISTTINGVIDWFVHIFNGVGDIFVIKENGVITGLSTWGTITFIPLAVGLVLVVLRWVIRLIRGI